MSSKIQSPTLVWFRKDLRIDDNSALAAAVEAGGPIIPVFIWSPEDAGSWALGAASQWWLHQALSSFDEQWRNLGGRLVLRQGQSKEELRRLIEETGAVRLFWNRRYEGPLRELDAAIKRELTEAGVEVRSFNSSLLNEPHTAATGSGQPYKVYTPYWRKVKDRVPDAPVEVNSAAIRFLDDGPESATLEDLNLLPEIPWYKSFLPHWKVSEAGAHERLRDFLADGVSGYDTERDRPDQSGTSQLSPYLHWGQIGPRQVFHALTQAADLSKNGPQIYLKEIYWREFAYNVLYHFPETSDQPLRPEYADFPWKHDEGALLAWQKGQTGYPIVDAGMRQLWEMGWMHNRVRMVVSSLLVKHLLQDWKAGARWFWDTLVDADLASNTLGWQWSGGCGADAAPYFRVFNPITQGKKFDPEGDYVRRFVPELKNLDAAYIHEPWEAPTSVLKRAGIELGKNYPRPIIEHKAGRERALKAFEAFRK